MGIVGGGLGGRGGGRGLGGWLLARCEKLWLRLVGIEVSSLVWSGGWIRGSGLVDEGIAVLYTMMHPFQLDTKDLF